MNPDQIKMSEATTVQEAYKSLKQPKEVQILRALQESDKLIRNLMQEGAIAEESIFANQVIRNNAKALK